MGRQRRRDFTTIIVVCGAVLAGCDGGTSSSDTCEVAFEPGAETFTAGLASSTVTMQLAQSFITGKTEDITVANAKVYLMANGLPKGNLVLTIEEGTSQPGGVALATKTRSFGTDGDDLISEADVDIYLSTTTPEYFEFAFSSDVTLDDEKTYWVRLAQQGASVNGTDHVVWVGNASDGFGDGQARNQNAVSTWVDPATTPNQIDYYFKVGCVSN